ncbi:MAG: helix-turn-helix domain-containing protein [Eubacteriales bacterium]|nr:helix-turn-helix domain-containing protein [Eubacteriales bacterium]
METRYTVRQAVEMTGVKSYVLRYWEEELELRIHRNELGHRYYTGYDIQLFLNIKELKKRGLRLQAIRELIPKLARTVPGTAENRIKLLEDEDLEQEVSDEIAEEEVLEEVGKVNNKKILEFETILERLIAQELKFQNENEDEERCRSLDLAIRRQQLARKEAAATVEKRSKKKL